MTMAVMSGNVDAIGIKVSTTNGAACNTTTIDRNRRQCRSIIDTICRSIDLTVKAFALLVCCILLTLKRQDNNETKHKRTLYATLNVTQNATAAEIKAAHRRLAIKYHPDKLLASGDAIDTAAVNDSFIAIQAAYEVLSDPIERSRYDSALSSYSAFVRRPLSASSAPDAAARYVRRRPTAFFTGAAADGPASRTASAASSTTATPPPSSHSAVSAPSSPATPTAFHIPTNVHRSSSAQRNSPIRSPTPTATPPFTSSSSFSRNAPLSPLKDNRGTFGLGIVQTIQWIVTIVMIFTAPIQWAVLAVTALQQTVKQRSSSAVIPAQSQHSSQRNKNQPFISESCSSVG